MNNIKLNPLIQAAVVLHPYYSASERIAQVWLNGQQSGKCVNCVNLFTVNLNCKYLFAD